MYNFIGRYDGLDRSSSKRIFTATITTLAFMGLSNVPLFIYKEDIFGTNDTLYYGIQLILLTINLLITYRIQKKISGEDGRAPELTLFEDGTLKYKKFHKNREDFTAFKFQNFNLKVIENEHRTIMVETPESEKFVLYRQYNATKRTVQLLAKDFPNQHYSVLVKWFELQYDRKYKKLRLVLKYCADMDKRGAFDMNEHEIF